MDAKKSLVLGCLALVTLAGCAPPERGDDPASSDEQNLSQAASLFDLIEYSYAVDVSVGAPPADMSASDCRVFVEAKSATRTYMLPEAASYAQPFGGALRFQGTIRKARHMKALQGAIVITCKRDGNETKSVTDVTFSGFDSPKIGGRQTLDGALASALPGGSAKLTVETKAINPTIGKVSSNCPETIPSDTARFVLRARTSVWKDMPWTAPYGDDWIARLQIDGSKYTREYHPKLGGAGEAIVVYCRPKSEGETLHVKLDVKEDDLFIDDRYKAIERDMTRGDAFDGVQAALGASEGARPIDSQLDVQ